MSQELYTFANLESDFLCNKELLNIASEEKDVSAYELIETELDTTLSKARKLRLKALFNDKEDTCNCFLEVQAGAGGTEAQDWAMMLLRMYTRWAEATGRKSELLEESQGEEAGIKSATIKITGNTCDFVYGWLKGESGVHRLVRISPFDSSARRHTSFASVWVSPEISDSIKIDIQEKDLRVDTYRASGAGGQHVNKTDSAIRITHIPTGLVVQCQNDRSQHRNRAVAMDMLKAKIYEKERQKRQEEIDKINTSEKTGISWGRQIRSYVLQPYQMVKDLRTGEESGNPSAILDGDIDQFLEAYLLNF